MLIINSIQKFHAFLKASYIIISQEYLEHYQQNPQIMTLYIILGIHQKTIILETQKEFIKNK